MTFTRRYDLTRSQIDALSTSKNRDGESRRVPEVRIGGKREPEVEFGLRRLCLVFSYRTVRTNPKKAGSNDRWRFTLG
jgi:hypothetical protein